ncbi:MAG: YdeI/OmpD-associated family protein [Cyclobacteriaceae bacterium]|nr:YdeI/OmpD-associated family protein [Cyclobacteriaceae bacterium]
MEIHRNVQAVKARTRNEWRRWLEKNHASAKAVWLVIFHKGSNRKSISYNEAVEEAICFGWIDSIAQKRDEQSKYQYFAPRKEKSNWSKANRERAEKMIAQGRMTPAGQKLIDLAKKTGTWHALVDVQKGVIPEDLQKKLNQNKKALKNFHAFPPSSKRIILEWISNAKKEETRQKRIEETVRLAAQNIRANHYRQ